VVGVVLERDNEEFRETSRVARMRLVFLFRVYNRHTWQNDRDIRMWEANSTIINDSVQKISLFESGAPLSYEAVIIHWERNLASYQAGYKTKVL
jgi:hypothetical protein